MTLYILNYNNYYNRLVKREETLADYQPYAIYTLYNTNFNPSDNVNTQHVFGDQLNGYDGKGDYCIVADGNEIVSRWFIIETMRTRGGQWQVTLHRDLIADYRDTVINSPMFIEKATLDDTDPFIFNNEDMTFNQIKQSETMLRDFTKCPWIVGYFARGDGETSSKAYSGKVVSRYNADIIVTDAQGAITTLDEWGYSRYIADFFHYYPTSLTFTTKLQFRPQLMPTQYFEWSWRENNSGTSAVSGPNTSGIYYSNDWNADGKSVSTVANYWSSHNYYHGFSGMYDLVNSYLSGGAASGSFWASQEQSSMFENLAGKTIQYRDEDSGQVVIKKITVRSYSTQTVTEELQANTAGRLYTTWTQYLRNAGLSVDPTGVGDSNYAFTLVYRRAKIVLETATPVDSTELNFTIPAERVHAIDAPFDMFCIPYSENFKMYLQAPGGTQNFYGTSKTTAMNFATGIGNALGEALYDVQLLPYCPLGNISVSNVTDEVVYGRFADEDFANTYGYTFLTNSQGGIQGYMLFGDRCNFTLDIELEEPIVVTNPKIDNLTKMYRLCSPNYQGVFQFSAAKNGGVESVNVDCTYLPTNPYIHVNPNFKQGYLYGQDFDDSRGLICAGDFSLGIVTNAWINYQLNNKNYEAAFNRQIESLELQNKYQKVADITNAITGTATGVGAGAVAGSAGGPVGTIIGGVVGGVASAAGGIADVVINEKLRNDALDLTKDQFGYQLGNIQARPQTISKTTAYTQNNKIFPFIEYYTCTPEEVQALENKIKYNGMTVMRIDTMSNYLRSVPTYIKGKIIRLLGLNEDYHILNTIASELNKGVYI